LRLSVFRPFKRLSFYICENGQSEVAALRNLSIQSTGNLDSSGMSVPICPRIFEAIPAWITPFSPIGIAAFDNDI